MRKNKHIRITRLNIPVSFRATRFRQILFGDYGPHEAPGKLLDNTTLSNLQNYNLLKLSDGFYRIIFSDSFKKLYIVVFEGNYYTEHYDLFEFAYQQVNYVKLAVNVRKAMMTLDKHKLLTGIQRCMLQKDFTQRQHLIQALRAKKRFYLFKRDREIR